MSDYSKGARKQKKSKGTNTLRIGSIKIKYDLLIAILMGAFYAMSIVVARLSGGQSGLIMSIITLVAFIVFSYLMKSGTLKGVQKLMSLAYVLTGLAALSFIWELLLYLNVPSMNAIGIVAWPSVVGIITSIVSLCIIAVILYLDKDSLKNIYLRAGDNLNIAMGIGGFIFCVLLAIGTTYFLFGGNAVDQGKLVQLIASVLVFSILGGIVEELWFRGLLMSKSEPILGESYGNIYQAVLFSAFEAVMFFIVTGQSADLTVVTMLGAIAGFYWGQSTLRTKSLLSPMLLHAGLYTLIMLPVLIGLLT